jgi:hypothetical protein
MRLQVCQAAGATPSDAAPLARYAIHAKLPKSFRQDA